MNLEKKIRKLMFDRANQVSTNAYAPYSNFFVGAAVLTKSEEIYTGCNVENSSYGLTICAERNAIFNAVTSEGKLLKIKALIITNNSTTCSPCGACRQVIMEFSDNNTIIIYKYQNKYIEKKLVELLPDNFKIFK